VTFRKTLLCVVIMLAGCAPTIPHGLGRIYDKKVYETLHTGEVTRTDVLMTLGEPQYRFEEDRFFMYEWEVAYAWGYIPYGLPFPICWPHYLCLEFTTDSFLIRREHFIGDIYGEPEKAIQKCTLMNQQEKTP
jgi:hypothetical protein